ncbi:UNVERIFIED_CONTAM: hypothetical protein FKN15_009305 [Acipenser sinensis]
MHYWRNETPLPNGQSSSSATSVRLLSAASCPQGWVPFKSSCYKTGKGIEQWSAAQKSCALSLQRAHLADIETEEEYLFISSYLKTFNHVIMLWTGLNDKQTEGELRWTDGSAYNLGNVMTSNLPHNETDCYALQMNATGPNYFFTGFFCYIPLPYLCEYEFPSAPEHFGFQLEDVKETEVSFIWSGLEDWMEALVKSDVIIQYQMKFSRVKQQSRILLSNITRMTISGLSPGNLYLFSLTVTSAGGALITLGPILSAETRPNPPLNATVKTITSREIPLYWTAPDKSQGASFDHYLISYVDVQTNTKETLVVENYKTSAVIPSIKPYHPYRISIQTVAAAGSGSCVDASLSVITAVSPPKSVSINLEDVGEENVTLQWDPPQEQIDEYYILVRSVTIGGDSKNYSVNNSNSFELIMLTPGMTYEIGVAAVRNGNMSELKTIQQTLRPKRVQIVVPYELNTHSVVLYVQKPRAGIYDGINVTYKEGSQRTPVSIPERPQELQVMNTSPSSFSLCWRTPYGHVDRYQVDLIPDQGFVTVTELGGGELQVAAENSAGSGLFSSSILFKTAESVPGLVTNLTASAYNHTTVKVTWFLPRRPNGLITKFLINVKHARSGQLERQFEINAEGIMKGTLPNCHFSWTKPITLIVEQLKSYTAYVFEVSAFTNEGEGLIASYMVRMPESAFSSMTASALPAQFSWTKPIALTVEQLKSYTAYVFEVSAFTNEGEGLIASYMVRMPESVPEDPPQSIAMWNITSKSFTISWDPPTVQTGKFNYRIELYGPSGHIFDNSTRDLKFTYSGLTPYTTYTVFVGAETFAGPGPKTNVTLVTPAEAPSAVNGLKALAVDSTSVKLSWKSPLRPNGIITQYRILVFRKPPGILVQNITLTGKTEDLNDTTLVNDAESTSVLVTNLSAEQMSHVIKTLIPFTEYMFSVAASTDVGEGPSTNIIVKTREQVPSSVQGVYYQNITSTSILVSWKPPTNPNGKITHFTVYGMELLTKEAFHKVTNETSIIISGLKKYTEYKLRVAASTGVGESSLSEEDDIFARTMEDDFHTENSTTTIATLQNLKPHSVYTISIRAYTKYGHGNQTSSVLKVLTGEDAPGSPPFNLTYESISSTKVEVSWIPPLHANGIILSYTIEYWNASHSLNISSNSTTAILSNLRKYTQYCVTVSAYTKFGNGNQTSDILNVTTLEDDPDTPPQNVTAVSRSYHAIDISWRAPEVVTGPTAYLIDVTSVDSQDYNRTFMKRDEESKNIELSDLTPFTRYSVIVIAFTGDVNEARIYGKASAPVIVITLQDTPKDPPKNVTLQKIPDDVTKVYVMFSPPSEPNGDIQFYRAVVCKEEDPTDIEILDLRIIENNTDTLTAVIEGLKGGHTYNISVYAVNGAGPGPKTELKITMDIQAPPESSMIPVPAYDKHGAAIVTARTMTIQMPVCFFSDSHGPIEKIQVIIAEAKVRNDGNITTWKDAYFNKPRPYFSNKGFENPPCTERMKRQTISVGTYVLGAEDTCMSEGNEARFCNGPLKPKKDYVFKFRATNFKGQYTDSVYSKIVTTAGEGLSSRTVEIILAVALCVLSVILLGAAIYAFARIRQKQKEGGTYSPRDAETIDTKFKLDQLITVADLELKEEKLTRPVNKKSFLQHVEDLCANDNVKFQEEFSELPKLLQDLATSDADLPWNRSKNRFTNIKPYNNNRVKLISEAGVPGSDYINASYMSGYLCPNEFIATQGPLPGTVADFWRMIWETRTRTIAMLTQCFEKGRIRCHQYWPEDNKPVTVFGDIVITKLTEDVHPDWTIRDLKVERHGDCMVVRHFNFTSWPEHGVPESSTALIHFVKLIRVNRAHDNTTIAVHCSAGVGRTGVFIGLDHLVQHVSDHDFVDIYGLVAELRSERMCMVQNLAQYMFLHQCALDLLSSKGNSQSIWFVNYSALEKMDSLEAMEGDVELEWEETTM